MKKAGNLPQLIEAFFMERLICHRQVSQHTIVSYRDTFCLLLEYIRQRLKKLPVLLNLSDLNVSLISDFLKNLEKKRGISIKSRNQRLAAIRSFFKYAALRMPDHSALISQVLSIPNKRCGRSLIGYLSREEIEALLAAPDRKKWIGRRDHALLLLAIQTGLRVSELTGLTRKDIKLGPGAYVRCYGKGRKERCTPLTRNTEKILKYWLQECPGNIHDPLFPTINNTKMSPDIVQYLLKKYVKKAGEKCTSLIKKKVSPHVLRHTTAMELLQSGVDCSVIALWLGHESVQTTQIYLEANLKIKEEILEKMTPIKSSYKRYRPDDQLLVFLKNL